MSPLSFVDIRAIVVVREGIIVMTGRECFIGVSVKDATAIINNSSLVVRKHFPPVRAIKNGVRRMPHGYVLPKKDDLNFLSGLGLLYRSIHSTTRQERERTVASMQHVMV